VYFQRKTSLTTFYYSLSSEMTALTSVKRQRVNAVSKTK